jgi:DNA polymerase-3 subunit alpha
MQPRNLEEISVINAIGRPGPLEAGLLDIYLGCRSTGAPPEDMPQAMSSLLADTHFAFIYQEQVMKLAVELAGFSMPDSDGLRKAIGKKKPKEMAVYEKMFKEGCLKEKILDKEQTDQLWTDINAYADYCFNKAHSYAYSLLGYWELWLKTYYPLEFMTALMTAESTKKNKKKGEDKMSTYVAEARSLGLNVKGPDLNKSGKGFTVHNEALVFGFSSIKGLGKTVAGYIVKARGNILFKDFYEFMSRINRRKVTSINVKRLILAGAFDSMGYDRDELFAIVDDVVKYYKDVDEYHEKTKACDERDTLRAKLTAAGEGLGKARALKRPVWPTKPVIEPKKDKLLITLDMLSKEMDVIGCYMTLHPMDFVKQTGDTDQIMNIFNVDQRGKINGVVCTKKEFRTRKGQLMAFLEVEDQTGRASITVFSYIWTKLKQKPNVGSFVRIKYKAEEPDSTPKRLIANGLRMLQIDK